MLPQLVFRKSRHDDRQLVRRQTVRVMQHRGYRQVFAADRAVDDDLQSLDGRKDIHTAPVTAGAIVIDH